MRPPEIIVGIDGSPESERALVWAANEAARHGAELRVLNVYDWNVVGAPSPLGASFVTATRTQSEELVAEAVATVHGIVPWVEVRGQAVFGHAAYALVSASANAATIVVGHRGRGSFASLLLGSVSQQVALHAHAPVVVVRGRPDCEPGPVVVGVDGSDQSQHALRVGFEEAAIRGAAVIAVRAYNRAGPSYSPDVPGYVEDPDERRDAERAALAADVAAWAEKYPEIHITCVAIEGHPGEVLTAQSGPASLVVVGSRGHGGFSGLLLGSVGLQLLHHAECPVLIARSVED